MLLCIWDLGCMFVDGLICNDDCLKTVIPDNVRQSAQQSADSQSVGGCRNIISVVGDDTQ